MLSAFESKPHAGGHLHLAKGRQADPRACASRQSAAVNGKVYVIGGFYNGRRRNHLAASTHDPANNTSGPAGRHARHPHPRRASPSTASRSGSSAARRTLPRGGDQRRVGLSRGEQHLEPGDPSSLARAAGGLVKLGRNLHYFGGFREDYRTDSPDHFVLNLDEGARGPTTWRSAAPYQIRRTTSARPRQAARPTPSAASSAATRPTRIRRRCMAYDPATNRWTQVAGLPKPRATTTPRRSSSTTRSSSPAASPTAGSRCGTSPSTIRRQTAGRN